MNSILGLIVIVLFFIVLYIIVAIVHEYGHWLAFKLYGFGSAKINWSIWKDIEIGTELHKKVNLKQSVIIALAGILAGAIPINIVNHFMSEPVKYMLMLAYIIFCFGDLNLLLMILRERDWNITLYEMNEGVWKDYKKDFV